MLILPDLMTPDITAKPDLKSLFPGTLKFFFNFKLYQGLNENFK